MLAGYKIIEANPTATKMFVGKLREGLSTFRYFNKRPVSIIHKHVVTSLIVDGAENPVAYGHLEFECGTLWLGIAVADDYLRMGFGTAMLNHLVGFARNNNKSTISLTVDNDNFSAQKLYIKNGFIKVEETQKHVVMRLELK